MSVYRLVKLADKFENKYRLLSQGQQVGPDPEAKMKYAMNALYRIVTLLEANKTKLAGPTKVAAENAIEFYRNIVEPKMKEFYNPASQGYTIPGENIINLKGAFEKIMPDISAATVALESFVPEQTAKLESLLNSLRANIQQLNTRDVEVFNP